MHVDTLDLYQARSRAAFVKAAALELGVSESVITGDLSALVLALEPVQDAAIRGALQPDVADAAPVLTAEQEAAGLALLRDPALVERIASDVEAIGVIGEGTNALVGYLAMTSRLLDKPLAILIQSTSAAGKSTLMDALLSLMPESQRVHYSAMTGQSLFYIGEGDLRHKILAIAEEEGVRQAAYALKLLQSQGELTIASTGKDPATGKLVTLEYRVEGPVILCLTTTAIDIDEELLNRCLVLTINETAEQTAAIQQRQRQARTLAGLQTKVRSEHVLQAHRAAQALLRPLAVVNPFAEQLTFASDRVRLRRDRVQRLGSARWSRQMRSDWRVAALQPSGTGSIPGRRSPGPEGKQSAAHAGAESGGHQMRNRNSSDNAVPAAAARYTATATTGSWRRPKSCSVTRRRCAACHRNSVITASRNSLPNQCAANACSCA